MALCDVGALGHELGSSDLDLDAALSAILDRLGLDDGSQRRAYGTRSDTRWEELTAALSDLGFETTEAENEIDLGVRLSVDALDLAARGKHRRFVLLGAGERLQALVQRLRQGDSEVSLVDVGQLLAEAGNGDSEEKASPSRASSSRTSRSPRRRDRERPPSAESTTSRDSGARPSAHDDDHDDHDRLLLEAIATVADQPNRLVWASLVLHAMQEADPEFNEQSAGFESFDEVIEDAERRGLLRCERHPDSDTYLITAYRS